jgi:hypothetical protein
MQDILKSFQLTSGTENKGQGIIHGNHDLELVHDNRDRCYGSACRVGNVLQIKK